MSLSSGDFRIYMRQLAGRVWRMQKDAFFFNLVLHEESITEMVLLNMARELTPLGFRVRLFNRFEEGGLHRSGQVVREGHGADWEWFYKSPACMVKFRVQAKLLRYSPREAGRYNSFNPKHRQVQDLIAKARQANPIYVFYNHPGVGDAHLFKRSNQPDHFGRSCWGCSVATAAFMQSVPDNKLSTIIRGQVPWHRFFGIGRNCRSEKAMTTMLGGQEFKRSDQPPEWFDLLQDSERSRDGGLEELLTERGLTGVAYFGYI